MIASVGRSLLTESCEINFGWSYNKKGYTKEYYAYITVISRHQVVRNKMIKIVMTFFFQSQTDTLFGNTYLTSINTLFVFSSWFGGPYINISFL